MVSNDIKLLEIEEIGQELAKKTKQKDLEQSSLNASITWTCGNILCCFGVFFVIKDNPWFMFTLFAIGAVIGLPFIFWASSRLKKINWEIERLEKRKKGLRNSIR